MSGPRALDLFSCAGGAAMGYHRAGFEVTCVDIDPQPRNPFEFIQADALQFVAERAEWIRQTFVVVVASPPCQVHSDLRTMAGPGHVDLIPQTREALEGLGLPYVIENVEGSTLRVDVELCGSMFSLGATGRVLRRHRWFESNVPLAAPCPCSCEGQLVGGVYGDGGGGPMTRGYKFYAVEAREAMGIDWMRRRELSQAIPPAYTEHLGAQLLAHLAIAQTAA